MKRAASAILAGLSLLLTLSAAGAWIMSHSRPVEWHVSVEENGRWFLFQTPDSQFGSVTRENGGHLRLSDTWRASWCRNANGRFAFVDQQAMFVQRNGKPVENLVPDWSQHGNILFGPTGVAFGLEGVLAKLGIEGLWGEYSVIVPVDGPGSSRALTVRLRGIMLPHWLPVALGLPVPLLWLRTHQRSRRWARQGRCPKCGYDLRASLERCPECGKTSSGSKVQP
jgi:hypothetical protein